MLKINPSVAADSGDTLAIELDRARTDILKVMGNNKIYINEKSYLTRCIELMLEMRYYKDSESLIGD